MFRGTLQWIIIAGLLAAIGYFISLSYITWEKEAIRADAVVVKAGLRPTVRFTPENREPVEVLIGTYSSREHKLGETVGVVYKLGPSALAAGIPIDVRIPGAHTLDVIGLYLGALICGVIAGVISIKNSSKRLNQN